MGPFEEKKRVKAERFSTPANEASKAGYAADATRSLKDHTTLGGRIATKQVTPSLVQMFFRLVNGKQDRGKKD